MFSYFILKTDLEKVSNFKQVFRYHFTNEIHPLPRFAHKNSKTSTPYKWQTPSTRELLRDAVKTSKPKEACTIVEVKLGGITNPAGPSALLSLTPVLSMCFIVIHHPTQTLDRTSTFNLTSLFQIISGSFQTAGRLPVGNHLLNPAYYFLWRHRQPY